MEVAEDLAALMINPADACKETTLAELFPAPFRLAPR